MIKSIIHSFLETEGLGNYHFGRSLEITKMIVERDSLKVVQAFAKRRQLLKQIWDVD
jgi:hypothetical protein